MKISLDMNDSTETVTDQNKWDKWFAWYPVKVHGKMKWMCTVYRRTVSKTFTIITNSTFMQVTITGNSNREYGTIFDVLSES